MIRTLTRNVICFLAAVVLLSLMVCALEVSLRAYRLRHQLHQSQRVHDLASVIAPSETTWINVRPLLDVELEAIPGKRIRIQTNEHGVRGGSVVVPKPRGVFRILCLGGDHVFGTGVSDRESLPVRLQEALNLQAGMPVEVINAGCPQSGPLINLLRYRAHLSTLQPDLVVLCLSEEDLGWDRDVRGGLHLDGARNPAYAAHPALRAEGSRILEGVCQEFVTIDWLLSWVGRSAMTPRSRLSGATPAVRENQHRDLAAIVPLANLISGNFGRLVVSVSPSVWGVDRARHAMDQTRSAFADDLYRFLNETRLADYVPVQDGLAAFCRMPDPQSVFSAETGALTGEGNELYARQLAAFLLETVPELGPTATSRAAPQEPPLR